MKPYYDHSGITIYNGDCVDVLPQLKPVDLLLTDPPYGIHYRSNYRKNKFDYIKGDRAFPQNWLGDKLLNSNGSLYIFANEACLDVAKLAIKEAKFNTIRMLVWDKGATAGGNLDDYGTKCEYILYSKRKYAKLRGSRDSNIISIPRVHPTILIHPAEKPKALVTYLIMKSTDYDDIVCDPFMGSGTTLVAAKELGRKAIGIEISEEYCELTVRRSAQEVLPFG